MLVVFRIVFGMPVDGVAADGEGAETCPSTIVLSVGTAGVELALEGFGVGSPDRVTDRDGNDDFLELVGRVEETAEVRRESAALALLVVEMASSDSLRVLGTGRAGNGPVGGGGRGVRGRADVILLVTAEEQTKQADWQRMPLAYLQQQSGRVLLAVIIGRRSRRGGAAASRRAHVPWQPRAWLFPVGRTCLSRRAIRGCCN